MGVLSNPALGIYEKAMPAHLDWPGRLKAARDAGYGFVEISIDETDQRLGRLDWTTGERKDFVGAIIESGVPIPSMCLSGHRRFPLGSEDSDTRATALEIMYKAIEFAVDTGIRNVQLAGYDVYYVEGNSRTRQLFFEGLQQAVAWASKAQVMLSMEVMDYPLMSSITRYLQYAERIPSPWFTVYPDIGNLSAWGNNIEWEFTAGWSKVVAIHLKDTKPVMGTSPAVFKEVPFGEGCVDFVAFFRLLSRMSYGGPFLIEMWTEKSADPIAEIGRARDWILEKMTAGGYTPC